MALRNARPISWVPSGVTDSVDGTNAFPGAMALLTNLIPDPTTRGAYICRPASIPYTWGSGAPPSGCRINSLKIIGDYAYFMAAGTGATAAKDIPYAYNLVTATFTAITGITAANTPTTPLATGNWEPPTMALIGTRLTVTHPGFNVAGGYYVGWLNISNPAAPAWSAGNTATNGFAARPVAVTLSRDGRAYYAVSNSIEASDASDPTTRTNAAQVLTCGDSVAINAFGGMPLSTQVSGGSIQSVIAFKGGAQMYQITGDYGSSWAQNQLNVQTGTNAPLSVTPTPYGLAFISPQGMRLMQFDGTVTEPIGVNGQGIVAPFLYAETPTRIVATCGGDVYRVTVKNGAALGAPWQEYWYDLARKIWTGPHDFPATMIQPYSGSFVLAPTDDPDTLYNSQSTPALGSTYVEMGTQMTWQYQTVSLPDTGMMAMNAMVETALTISVPAGDAAGVTVTFADQFGTVLDTVLLPTLVSSGAVWDSAVWDEFVWQAGASYVQRQIEWTIPLEFKQGQLLATGNSASDLRIGNLYMNYQPLGYLLAPPVTT